MFKKLFLFSILTLFCLLPLKVLAAPKISNANYVGKFISQSLADPIVITAGESREVTVKIKNIGKNNWLSVGKNYVSAYTVESNYHDSILADSSWLKDFQPTKILKVVKPGETAEIKIKLKAPTNPGMYREDFYLATENITWIKDSGFFLKVKVVAPETVATPPRPTCLDDSRGGRASPSCLPASSEEGGDIVTSSLFDNETTSTVVERELISEPTIRVGLYKAEESVKIISDYGYQVYFGVSTTDSLANLTDIQIDYKKGIYTVKSNGQITTSTDFVRLVPDDPNAYFIITNYNRKLSEKSKENFNAYRGILEFRYSPKSEAPFVINELPLEAYIAGIAETSNDSAWEYIKALLVAARSYAYLNISTEAPSDKRLFDVYASTVDQLYLGYNSEITRPRVAQAQAATFGEMVTYQTKPVLTPYFGHSNGYTKSWNQVWGGENKPWLQKVKCVYDQGKKLWGHGVGMSTNDASQRAVKEGWTYDQILKYYYTGTAVEKVY